MLAILKRAFIDPLQSPLRRRLYIATLLGCFAFSGMILYFGFSFAKEGPLILATYYLTKSIIGNTLFLPFLFFLLQKLKERPYFLSLIAAQVLVFGLTLLIPFHELDILTTAILFALLFSLFSAPFWLMYHALVIHSLSDENLGNELSIVNIGIAVGSMLGYSGMGIVALFFEQSEWQIFICFSIMVFSTYILATSIPEGFDKPKEGNILKAFIAKPWRTINTMLDGTFNFLTSFFAPVWLSFINLSLSDIGGFSALNVALKTLFSPLTGHWVGKAKGQEGQWGAGLMTAGWTPWLFVHSPFVLPVSYLLWGNGIHMFEVGLQSRWYKDLTYANMAAREIALGLGRSLACIIAIPLVFWNISAFFMFAAALSFLTIFICRLEQKK